MKNTIKQTETIHQAEKPVYQAPQIIIFKEEEMLKNVSVLGCSPFSQNSALPDEFLDNY